MRVVGFKATLDKWRLHVSARTGHYGVAFDCGWIVATGSEVRLLLFDSGSEFDE